MNNQCYGTKQEDHENRLILHNTCETMEESLKENMPSITVDRASRAGAELPTNYTSTGAEFYYSAGSERSEFLEQPVNSACPVRGPQLP